MNHARMTQGEVESLFTLAGIPVLKVKALIDGYGYPPGDPRYYEYTPRCVWWFVKTSVGWIEIGWRKKVIAIDWSDTQVKAVVTSDDVTKSDFDVHAWGIEKALEYLQALSPRIQLAADTRVVYPTK